MTLLVLSLLWVGVLCSQWGWIAGLSSAVGVGVIVGRMTPRATETLYLQHFATSEREP